MHYHLVFSADSNYMPYLFVVCQSILDHIEDKDNNAQDCIIFNVLTDRSVDLSVMETKAQSFSDQNQNCGIVFKFAWHVVDANKFSGFSSMTREGKISFSTYYRIVLDRLLPDDIQYAAYLDIDMLVLTDIRKLFKQYPLHNKVLGAVVDPGSCGIQPESNYISLSYRNSNEKPLQIPKETYFNAGLLLFNLMEWRKHNLSETCLELASQLILPLHDQDLLNYVCIGKTEIIDLSWNFQDPMFYVLYNKATGKYDINSALNPDKHWQCVTPSADDFERFANAPNIIHFLSVKPWQNDSYKCFIPFLSQGISLCPRMLQYKQQWLATEERIGIQPHSHAFNSTNLTLNDIVLFKMKNELKRDRKISQYGLIFLLFLNLITLTIALLK